MDGQMSILDFVKSQNDVPLGGEAEWLRKQGFKNIYNEKPPRDGLYEFTDINKLKPKMKSYVLHATTKGKVEMGHLAAGDFRPIWWRAVQTPCERYCKCEYGSLECFLKRGYIRANGKFVRDENGIAKRTKKRECDYEPKGLPVREYLRYGPHTLTPEVRKNVREYLADYGVPNTVTWDKNSLACANCEHYDGRSCVGGGGRYHREFGYKICDLFIQSIIERKPSTATQFTPAEEYYRDTGKTTYWQDSQNKPDRWWKRQKKTSPYEIYYIEYVRFEDARGKNWLSFYNKCGMLLEFYDYESAEHFAKEHIDACKRWDDGPVEYVIRSKDYSFDPDQMEYGKRWNIWEGIDGKGIEREKYGF